MGMLQATARVIRGISPLLASFLKAQSLFVRKDSFLLSSGFMRSCVAGHPCRRNDSPLPWMNYALIHFLEERLKPSFTLFEYGSGYSTLFFGRLVGRVVSVESNREWYKQLQANCPENVAVVYQAAPDADYCKLVSRSDTRYDVIVIDGHDRVKCAVNSCSARATGGVINIDDMHRQSNIEAARHLQQAGFKRIDFDAPKPGGIIMERASVFYKQENCLGI